MAATATEPQKNQMEPVIDALKGTITKALDERLSPLEKELEELKKPRQPGGIYPFFISKGESANTSRGYSYLKLFGLMSGQINKDYAKVEMDMHDRLRKLYVEGGGMEKAESNSILAPLASSHLIGMDTRFALEVRDVVKAGVAGYDPDEALWWAQKFGIQKALSSLDDTTGGSLLGPAGQGELIELLRNRVALQQAGAREITLPPNGRLQLPRHTGASTAFFVGESQAITASNETTGSLTLQAKKLACLVKTPNELIRFATVSIEQFIRDDIARVVALAEDKQGLDGTASGLKWLGIINYPNITTRVASTVGANGNTFEPEDIMLMISDVESNNADFEAFIMRPEMWAAIQNRRADAVTAGDKKGPWMFNTDRGAAGNRANRQLSGFPVVVSNQVVKNRTKGSGTDLTYILGGQFSEWIIGRSGVLEFATTAVGDTPFQNDETWIRGIQHVDMAPRHEEAFVFVDTLLRS